jgi:membrane-associated phospholipid phosphatase
VKHLRPVDFYTMVYLVFGLAMLAIAPHRPPNTALLILLHVAAIPAIVLARAYRVDRWKVGAVLLAFYPLAAFGLFYSEVGMLVKALHGGVLHDAPVQRLEEAVFRSQPARDLHTWWPWRPLGEYLHLGYFAYYVLTLAMAVVLWLSRPRRAFDIALGTVALSYYICFTIFVLYPVAGPYHAFPHIDPAAVGYVLPRLVRSVLDRGSSVGAAFPSSHVAVAVTVWIMAMRYHRPLAVVLAFIVPALALGAIYGGYHYAIDALAGAVLAVLVSFAGARATEALRRAGAYEESDAAARAAISPDR